MELSGLVWAIAAVDPEKDEHPPSVVTLGEQLIADVYNNLRASKVWHKTLLLITMTNMAVATITWRRRPR
jgi:hypothetical protein